MFWGEAYWIIGHLFWLRDNLERTTSPHVGRVAVGFEKKT